MTTYKILRFYFNDKFPTQTIKTGLTLSEAQEHCRDKETSSSTCKKTVNVKITRERGPWFDGYSEEL